jgi:hypothetical protein
MLENPVFSINYRRDGPIGPDDSVFIELPLRSPGNVSIISALSHGSQGRHTPPERCSLKTK